MPPATIRKPRVTVLLTCYNHLRYLPSAFESVLDQTLTDFEILALDDGSTDGTREWLAEQTDPRLRLILNEQNLGTYGTLNVGVRESKGDYIAILNDDDLWAPEKLGKQVAALTANPRFGLVHTSGWFIDAEGERHPSHAPLGFPFPHLAAREALPHLIDHNQIITSSVLVRREAFERCGLFDPEFYGCGDWHMWLRVAREYEIALVDEPLTFYRVHGANAALNDQKMFEDGKRIREWIATWEETCPDLRPAFAHNWACLGTERTWLGDKAGGRRAYLESVRRMPGRFKTYLRLIATFLPGRAFRKLQ